MKVFRHLAIRKKMLAITLLICGVVLCIAMVALFAFQVLDFRSNFQRDTATLAVIIANNSTAAMAFRDEQTAKELVDSLDAKPTILAATLVLPNGQTFAHYGMAEDAGDRPQYPSAAGDRFMGGQLLVTQPVILKGEQVGTLHMRADYRRTFLRLLGLYGEIVLGILIVSIALAAFLSSWLGRTITDPVLHLAQCARVVGEKKDYSVRANLAGLGDELGVLANAFNDMLGRIQSQEAALNLSHRKLLETSRQAGMAEVATGVLHNVGNVLNSVSVCATVVVERLRHSKVIKLRRATTLLREESGRLGEFLTVDPKGKVLPEYLASVADQLTEEQTKLIAKMDTLGEHVEHIKEVIAMQQSYAKVSGVYENLSVIGLVEDALQINAAAFDRHGIELVREFAQNLPPARVDRHKVLQILINLLRNAKYAMDQQNGDARRLIVRVGMAATGPLQITIADSGIGIPADNLTRIFNFGFTTKKDGHGFGLHSGANAAKEMGGTLNARSDGSGKGAEFTLELPAATALREEQPTQAQA